VWALYNYPVTFVTDDTTSIVKFVLHVSLIVGPRYQTRTDLLPADNGSVRLLHLNEGAFI
jgi:hypothetical protein